MTAPKTDSVHSVSPSGEAVRAALPVTVGRVMALASNYAAAP